VTEWEYLKKHVSEDEWKVYEDFIGVIERMKAIFDKQLHSGFTAHWFAPKIAKLVENRLLKMPLAPIYQGEEEWEKIGKDKYQSRRCSALFKDGDTVYYNNAIVWVDESGTAFTGEVNGITSRQKVKYPFWPKTFYVRIHYVEDADSYIIVDVYELVKALQYYEPYTKAAEQFLENTVEIE